MINKIGKEVGMTDREIKLFREILKLIDDKEKGMYESVQNDLDNLISEEIKNANKKDWV